MKIQEAIKSGKRFRRKGWDDWYPSIIAITKLRDEDLLEEDWEIEIIPITREKLISRLKELGEESTSEEGHGEADDLLIEYINDPEIKEAYENIGKWYA
jgi:hypothetical protein